MLSFLMETLCRDFVLFGGIKDENLDDFEKTRKYQGRYETMVKKYKKRDDPPHDLEKD